MDKTYHNMYSVGPGSIGEGTSVVKSLFNPRRDRGTITRMHYAENGIPINSLASLYTLSDAVFPGTNILLNYTFVRLLSPKLALIVSKYGTNRSSSGYKRVFSRSPSGYRSFPAWPSASGDFQDWQEDKSNWVGQFGLRPSRTVNTPLINIRWSSVVFQDVKPNVNTDYLIGKINTNNYSIYGYSHAPYTLKFGGTYIVKDEWAAYDRWTITHTATYDPLYYWRVDHIQFDSNNSDGTRTWSRPNNNGIPSYDPTNGVANFPSLP